MGFDLKKALGIHERIKKRRGKKDEDARHKQAARIENLFIEFYSFSADVKIPIPNAFSEMIIDRVFGGLDRIEFENKEHLGMVLFILENQKDKGLIDIDRDALRRKGTERMMDVPVPLIEEYQKALFEMYAAVKKNSNRRTQRVLAEVMDLLQN